MAAAPNGLVHGESIESTSPGMADLHPYGGNRRQVPIVPIEDHIRPQAVSSTHAMKYPDVKNTSGVAHLGTSSGGTPAFIEIRDPLYVTPLDQLLEEPVYIDCPYCQRRTQTRVTHEDSSATTYVT
ncbi:MAG: hypothetical protein ALECFALPRED_003156 [Alectoria fallacina]|uniref:LITAF domain-containing protein n=1 Tax=Alectoria fallacina TaxID=1903189 RepID=A0A8H3ITB3_9LECA|nr:MAG: hypothetical protein ALECFALPRED_003156 [Alectoria fallacina]